MATKKVYTWGEDLVDALHPEQSSLLKMAKHIERFLADNLDETHLGEVVGPKGEKYVIRIVVTLELKAE